jgi:multiple sugar transport system permease protein
MSGTEQVVAVRPAVAHLPRGPTWRVGARRADLAWAIAFLVPYAAVFLAFAAYPIVYALWMGSRPALYAELFDDPIYSKTAVNTLLFAGLGVNLMMFAALLLSGFFMRRGWWIKALLAVYVLPWALAEVQSFTSIHWILISEMGLVNRVLEEAFGIEGPMWFGNRWLALGCNIAAYIWKWMPFWTLVFMAGRMRIPPEVNEAAAIDGASGLRLFAHVTLPLLGNLYLVCTLLAMLWAIGDFNTAYFVSSGAPVKSSEVLATLGYRYTLDSIKPDLGVAAMMSAIPVLIPIVILLLRRLHTREVQL